MRVLQPDLHFVDKYVFFTCFQKIRQRLDLTLLVGYLMKYHLVRDSSRMEELTSSYLKSHDKMTSLVRMAEEAGPDGFMIIYKCLKESAFESLGHQAAVEELEKEGIALNTNSCDN